MATPTIDMRHKAIWSALVQHAGNMSDAGAIAEATTSTWNKMVDRLTPVIGKTGVYIVLGRALQIASKTTPCLLLVGNPEPGDAQLEGLWACIETQDADSAMEASRALLTTFTDLLATLIGNALTDQLLEPAWSSPPDLLQKENAPWKK